MRTALFHTLSYGLLAASVVFAAGCDGASSAAEPSALSAIDAEQGPAPSGGVRIRTIRPDTRAGRSAAVVVEHGSLVYTGQLHPVDASGALQGTGDARAQVGHVLDRLGAALAAAGSGLDRVARLHVYVADASVTPAVDRALAERFGSAPPAVTLVESRMAMPGVLVAADAVAATARAGQSPSPERLVVAGLARSADGAAHVSVLPDGPWVIVSGRAASGDFEAAVRGTMEQLRGDLQTAGQRFDQVVQVKAFLRDMAQADPLRRLVAASFEGTPPPIVVTEWRDGSLPVEIELVAAAPGASQGDERLTLVEPISARYSRIARIFAGRPVFVSGLTGSPAEPAAQVRDLFARMRDIVVEAGSDMRHLAKATYYVSDKTADQEINTIRPSIFDNNRPPAASKISVQGTGHADKRVVIDMVAVTTRDE